MALVAVPDGRRPRSALRCRSADFRGLASIGRGTLTADRGQLSTEQRVDNFGFCPQLNWLKVCEKRNPRIDMLQALLSTENRHARITVVHGSCHQFRGSRSGALVSGQIVKDRRAPLR